VVASRISLLKIISITVRKGTHFSSMGSAGSGGWAVGRSDVAMYTRSVLRRTPLQRSRSPRVRQ
jgi:hypothetical protein